MTINVIRVSDVRMIDGVAHVFLGKEKVLAKTEDRKFKLNGAYDACIPVQGNEDMIDEIRDNTTDGSGEPVEVELSN